MFSALFYYYTMSLSVFDDPIANYFAMGIVGWVAYLIAFRGVGKLKSYGIVNKSSTMSDLHWIIRLIVMFAICFLVATIFRIYEWVISIPIWIWFVLIGSIVFILTTVIIVNMKRKKISAKATNIHYE